MVVLASDTITPPLLPRNIHSHFQMHAARKLSSMSTTTNSRNNIANSWSTKTKIIFAVCIVVVIVLVFALALFLQCRRKRRGPRDRTSMEAIAENQGYGGFQPGVVRRVTEQMDEKEELEAQARFSEQSGPGMYGPHSVAGGHGAGAGAEFARAEEGRFENVPLETGGRTPTRPGGIYRYGEQQSRFSP